MVGFVIIGFCCGAGSRLSWKQKNSKTFSKEQIVFLPSFSTLYFFLNFVLCDHTGVVAEVLLLLKFLSERKRAQHLLSEAVPLGTCPR